MNYKKYDQPRSLGDVWAKKGDPNRENKDAVKLAFKTAVFELFASGKNPQTITQPDLATFPGIDPNKKSSIAVQVYALTNQGMEDTLKFYYQQFLENKKS